MFSISPNRSQAIGSLSLLPSVKISTILCEDLMELVTFNGFWKMFWIMFLMVRVSSVGEERGAEMRLIVTVTQSGSLAIPLSLVRVN